jgi:SnoaL-like domain
VERARVICFARGRARVPHQRHLGVGRNGVELDRAAVDDALATNLRAWNEQDPDQRRRQLERCFTDDVVLVDPSGRWEGMAGLAERIGRYQSAAPDTEVVTASGVDATTTSCVTPGRSSIGTATTS